MGCSFSVFQYGNYCHGSCRCGVLLDESGMKYTFRPRNNIRLEKALLKSEKLISAIRPELTDRIKIYFIDLGTEFGFTRKHMIKLFEKRIKYESTETENKS